MERANAKDLLNKTVPSESSISLVAREKRSRSNDFIVEESLCERIDVATRFV